MSKRNKQGNGQSQDERVDLLEIGPDLGEDLLEFEGSSHQKAMIKVIGNVATLMTNAQRTASSTIPI